MATLAEQVGRIAEQTRQRVVDGVTPAGATRMVSLHDPDARPIRKGRLGKPVGECGIDTDENLESQYWEGDRRLVHIGTEDIDILERRLPYCRFLGAPPPRYTDHPTYVAGGMNVTIPYVKRGTTITLHYIVAENPLPEPMEYSTSYAVDLAHRWVVAQWP